MAFLPIRSRTFTFHLRALQDARLSSHTPTAPRGLSSLTTGRFQSVQCTTKNFPIQTLRPTSLSPEQRSLNASPRSNLNLQLQQSRLYGNSNKNLPTADAVIEELQDLYEIAKDEFEIATESTDGGTIYAASDRDSARDALNDLCATYFLYTHKPGDEDTGILLRSGEKLSGSKLLSGESVILSEGQEEGEGRVVDTGFEPQNVEVAVREEVRRRVGQRVRELRNAVEHLEERAMEE
ncbi:uncharacterized protein N7483_011307 [Penicillium malachiteum]|uniref:uncharacterized protein n=1 Tax=Penicillium malachiteum TaxID=1324776 RepID=UPI002547D75E|nr:uncharacterized protein N7483_011307 [Penicillium malachiteum]KAJ5714126.1 hypothetical protein N7483_011307 [Penicillium malachiteum]